MTDTTNHAEVVRNFIETSDPLGNSEDSALAALDALTRELEEAKALRDHYQKEYEFWYQSDRDHKAAVDAQSARIAKLEGTLLWIINCTDSEMGDGDGARDMSRAALAPKEVQP